jgi:predicted nucleic acid-binding protein
MLVWVIDGPVERHDDAALAVPSLELSLAAELSVYDGLYAVLAESLGVPLVTADRRLAERVPGAVLVT